MFKHILMPVDGTEFSAHAIEAGIRLARSIQARITGFIAEPVYMRPSYSEMITHQGEHAEDHTKRMRNQAETVLRRIGQRAHAAGVDFDGSFAESDDPALAIINTAQENDCDLIVMASHGRRGLDKLLHGSITENVISHTRIPVLVLH